MGREFIWGNQFLYFLKYLIFRTVRVDAYDLISIGDDASLNSDVLLETVRFINGYMVVGSIAIGSRCFIGNRAAIIGGLSPTVMKQEAILGDLSLLTPGSKVAAGEVWSGSPATKKGAAELVDWELAEEMRPSNCIVNLKFLI